MLVVRVRHLAILSVFVSLVACTKKQPEDAATNTTKAAETVNLFTWSGYTSELLDEFTKQTGIKVVESNYSSNEELLAKLQAGATDFDVAIPSDYMVAVMAKLGLLQELDKAKLPNFQNLDPKVLGKSYDPENKYAAPYAWSITGIAVNRKLYKDPVTGWGDLLTNPKVAGKISLLDDVRESMGAALKLNGYSLNSVNPAELKKAQQTLVAVKPAVKAFNSTPTDLIKSGEVALAHMYAQEALLASRASGGAIEFVVPKEGATMAIDNLVVLKAAPHKDAALKLINFLLDRKSNAKFVSRMLAGPVVKDVKADLPKELQDNATLFPPPEVVARFEMMHDLGEGTKLYDRIWSEVKISSGH